MRRIFRPGRSHLAPLVAVLIVLALGVGTVYAAIPSGSGTYSPASPSRAAS